MSNTDQSVYRRCMLLTLNGTIRNCMTLLLAELQAQYCLQYSFFYQIQNSVVCGQFQRKRRNGSLTMTIRFKYDFEL